MTAPHTRTMRTGIAATLVAAVTLAATAPSALGQLHLPRLFSAKTPAEPKTDAKKSGQEKESSWVKSKFNSLSPSQQRMSTEVVGGTFGGALAGGVFGSFAGPAGTVIGAAGGALAGGVGAAAGTTFKEHARRRWGWR